MKNINWYKIGVFVLLGVLLLLLTRGCGKGGGSFFSCNKSDTVSHTIDTTIRKDSIVVVGVPVPYKVIDTFYLPGKPRPYAVYDTLYGEGKIREVDTAEILRRYYEVAYYKDVKDIKRGTATIYDTVTQNRIVGRSLKVVVSDTTIREVITLTQPKRLILFFGVSATGSRKDPFHMAGMDLTLKGKNDRMYSVGANIDQHGTLYGTFGYRIPIKLTKKK